MNGDKIEADVVVAADGLVGPYTTTLPRNTYNLVDLHNTRHVTHSLQIPAPIVLTFHQADILHSEPGPTSS